MAKKLPMLEEFEQQKSNGCKCGGNCQCNKVNEAKKYKFKDLAKAWEYVYGEDMEDEYHGFYQEVTGKHRDKVTKDDVAMIWNKVYGEDIASEYDAFFNSLQENLNEANKLEEFNLIGEKSDKDIAHDILQDLLNEFDPWELDAMLPQEAEETVLSYGHKGAKAKKIAELLYDYAHSGAFESKVTEANADGTISDDEDERREDLLANTEATIDQFLADLKEQSYEIGGKFRGPGILHENMKLVQDKVKRFR